jgi:hypothetical protein
MSGDKPKAGRKPTGSVVVGHRKDGATVYTIRFQAGGRRRTVTLGSAAEGWDRTKAETELRHVLADVERGLWRPPTRTPAIEPGETPTFHEFASEWFERHKHEVQPRTIEYWLWVLSGHVLPFFKDYPLDAITVEMVDRFKVAKQPSARGTFGWTRRSASWRRRRSDSAPRRSTSVWRYWRASSKRRRTMATSSATLRRGAA